MPQFDLSHYSAQIFWLILSFSALFLLISCFFSPAIRSILDQRKNHLTKMRAESQEFAEKIAIQQAQRSQCLEEETYNAKKLIEQATLELENLETKRLEQIHHTMEKKFEDFQRTLQEEKKNMQSEIDVFVKKSVRELLPKILGDSSFKK